MFVKFRFMFIVWACSALSAPVLSHQRGTSVSISSDCTQGTVYFYNRVLVSIGVSTHLLVKVDVLFRITIKDHEYSCMLFVVRVFIHVCFCFGCTVNVSALSVCSKV